MATSQPHKKIIMMYPQMQFALHICSNITHIHQFHINHFISDTHACSWLTTIGHGELELRFIWCDNSDEVMDITIESSTSKILADRNDFLIILMGKGEVTCHDDLDR